MTTMPSLFEEDVNGQVIGAFTYPYEFWTLAKNEPDGIARKIAKGHFQNDQEAEEWFKEKFPQHFKTMVEMRVFCGG